MSDPFRPRPAQQRNGASGEKPAWNKDIKAYYDAVASEPIPEEIQNLMATLAKAIRK